MEANHRIAILFSQDIEMPFLIMVYWLQTWKVTMKPYIDLQIVSFQIDLWKNKSLPSQWELSCGENKKI